MLKNAEIVSINARHEWGIEMQQEQMIVLIESLLFSIHDDEKNTRLFIATLDEQQLDVLMTYFDKSIFFLKKMLFENIKILGVQHTAYWYAMLLKTIQAPHDPIFLERYERKKLMPCSLIEQQIYCVNHYKSLIRVREITGLLNNLPHSSALKVLKKKPSDVSFLTLTKQLIPFFRSRLLHGLVTYLPRIIIDEVQLDNSASEIRLSPRKYMQSILQLLSPEDGLPLLMVFFDTLEQSELKAYFGLFKNYLALWDSNDKAHYIKRDIQKNVSTDSLEKISQHFAKIGVEYFDDYIILKQQLSGLLNQLSPMSFSSFSSLSAAIGSGEQKQKRIVIEYFLNILTGRVDQDTTSYATLNACQNIAREKIKDIPLNNALLEKLIKQLYQALDNEKDFSESSDDSDSSDIGSHWAVSKACAEDKPKPKYPNIPGLIYLLLDESDRKNSFFVAFNEARRSTHASLDPPTLRTVIAQDLVRDPLPDLHQRFAGELHKLQTHAEALKAGASVEIADIQRLTKLLRIPLFLICQQDPLVFIAFQRDKIKQKPPVFIYQNRGFFIAMKSSTECSVDETIQWLDTHVNSLC